MSETPQRSTRRRTPVSDAPVSDYGRIPPQAIDMEKAVLGALMIEPDAFNEIGQILVPESFYENRHQKIFTAIRALSADRKPIDILTVQDQLAKDGCLDEVGGAFYLTELSTSVLSAAHIDYHARIVAQKALARELISYSNQIQKSAFDETQDVDELMQKAEGDLFEISKKNITKDYIQIDPIVKEAYHNIQVASSRENKISGLESGFSKLDKITGGWQNSDLIIIAARPAMGKTAFVLSMAKNMALNYKIPVGFFSLEMSNIQLVNRLISNVCEIESDKIKSGRLSDQEWQRLDYKISELLNAPIYVDDTPQLSVFELRSKARRLVREHGVKVIMIDYLQLMNASGMHTGNRQEEVSTISRHLKGLAKELNIPIIALSQLNRGVETRISDGNKSGDASVIRPQLNDLRESGAIEQDADMVCFIHRPEYYKIFQDGDGRDLKGKAEFIIAKHRNGAVGEIRLRFIGSLTRFSDLDDQTVKEKDLAAATNERYESRMNQQADDPELSGAISKFDDILGPVEGSMPF